MLSNTEKSVVNVAYERAASNYNMTESINTNVMDLKLTAAACKDPCDTSVHKSEYLRASGYTRDIASDGDDVRAISDNIHEIAAHDEEDVRTSGILQQTASDGELSLDSSLTEPVNMDDMETMSEVENVSSSGPDDSNMNVNEPDAFINTMQAMCESLKKRDDLETAVLILNKNSEAISTVGSSAGTAFLSYYPHIATMFQDFCGSYNEGQMEKYSRLYENIADTSIKLANNTDKIADTKLEHCTNFEIEPKKTTGDQNSEVEQDSDNNFQEVVEIDDASSAEVNRTAKQMSKISKKTRIGARCRKKKTTDTIASKETTLNELTDSYQSNSKLAETLSVVDNENCAEIKIEVQPSLACSLCNKSFKSKSGLSAHDLFVHNMKDGSVVCKPKHPDRNSELRYYDKDGNETSGNRCSMYEKQTEGANTTFCCNSCSYSSKKYNSVIEHTDIHIIRDPFICKLCDKTFKAKNSLWRHTNHHKKFPHVCKTCHRMYEAKEELEEHETRHKVKHICKVCGRIYESIGRLNYHIKTSHGPKQNTCEVCGSSFSNKSLLRQHKKRHGPKLFFCDKCESSYYFMHQLTTHLKIHDDNSFKYKCTVCPKQYINKSHWKEHMKAHDGSNFVQCDKCGKSYNSKKTLNLHMSSTHVDERRFICQICGKAFLTKHHLKNHLISHDEKRDYKCTFCDATFKKKDILKMHENVHTQERKFMCDICGEHFLRRSSLRNHRLTHIPGHKRWKCRYCENKFRTQSAMMTHIKNKHTDVDLSHDRPLCRRCDQCGKVFAKGITFRIHMDMHAGIKRYKCRVCENAFTDPANLRVHLKIHDGSSKRYVCHICNTRFSSAKQFTLHMEKHHEGGDHQTHNALNTGLDLTTLNPQRREDAGEKHTASSTAIVREQTSHSVAAATLQEMGAMHSSLVPMCMNTSHMLVNTNCVTPNHLMINPIIRTSIPCQEDMNMNADIEGGLRSTICVDPDSVTNQNMADTLRQSMDIKNYDQDQLHYSAMF